PSAVTPARYASTTSASSHPKRLAALTRAEGRRCEEARDRNAGRGPHAREVRASLRRERAAATAAAGRVRILEGETGALHRRHVVDRDPVEILRRERIDEPLVALLPEHDVVVGRLLLDEQAVAEAAAPAGLNAHAEPAVGDGHAFLL